MIGSGVALKYFEIVKIYFKNSSLLFPFFFFLSLALARVKITLMWLRNISFPQIKS